MLLFPAPGLPRLHNPAHQPDWHRLGQAYRPIGRISRRRWRRAAREEDQTARHQPLGTDLAVLHAAYQGTNSVSGVLSPASVLISSLAYRTASSLASTTMPGARISSTLFGQVEPTVGDGGAQQLDHPVAVRVGRAQRG